MKLFSFRMRAISVFTFDTGMSTRRCFDPQALRIRVSISAIGSVMLMSSIPFPYRIPRHHRHHETCRNLSESVASRGPCAACSRVIEPRWSTRPPRSRLRLARMLPAGLSHAGDHPVEREVAEADAAEPELPKKGARAPAAAAAIVLPHLEL